MCIFQVLWELLKGFTPSVFWIQTVWYSVLSKHKFRSWKWKNLQSWTTLADKQCFSPQPIHLAERSLLRAVSHHAVWVHLLSSTGWTYERENRRFRTQLTVKSEQCQSWDSTLRPRRISCFHCIDFPQAKPTLWYHFLTPVGWVKWLLIKHTDVVSS